MTDQSISGLAGRTILVVEDDYILARDMTRTFERSGATILGPVSNVDDALNLLETASAIDGAVLDINLMGEMVYPVADALRASGVPFVFATGYDANEMPARYGHIICLEKPVEARKIAEALFG